MSFLDYNGRFDIMENSDNFSFNFYNNNRLESLPFFIVPPIYDITFKRVFFYNSDGLAIVKDFLNNILFPESWLIYEINFIEKEILSNSHIKNNKGTRIVDCAYLAKIKSIEKGEVVLKEIIIDIEMENGKISDAITKQCFDYGCGLRYENDFKETWIIALCIDDPKYCDKDKNAKCYVKKEFTYGKSKILNYVKIYEIYLNTVYANLHNQVSVINGELIKDEGKEWFKLFCIPLWCKSFGDNINYCIPHSLNFKGKEIKKAIKILGDIQNIEQKRIKILEMAKKEKEEEKYQEGYGEGKKKGYNNGYEEGEIEGKNIGYSECILMLLDKYFKNFINGKSLENIDMLGSISYSLMKERYKNNIYLEDFAKKLKEKNLLIQ